MLTESDSRNSKRMINLGQDPRLANEVKMIILKEIVQCKNISEESFSLLTQLLQDRAIIHETFTNASEQYLESIFMNSIKATLLSDRITACIELTQQYELIAINAEDATAQENEVSEFAIWLWQENERSDDICYRTRASDAYLMPQSIQRASLPEDSFNELTQAIKNHTLQNITLKTRRELFHFLETRSSITTPDNSKYFTINTTADVKERFIKFLLNPARDKKNINTHINPDLNQNNPSEKRDELNQQINIETGIADAWPSLISTDGMTHLQNTSEIYLHEKSKLNQKYQEELDRALRIVYDDVNKAPDLTSINNILCEQRTNLKREVDSDKDILDLLIPDLTNKVRDLIYNQGLIKYVLTTSNESPTANEIRSYLGHPRSKKHFFSTDTESPSSLHPNSSVPRSGADHLSQLYENSDNLAAILNANMLNRHEDRKEILDCILKLRQISPDQTHVLAWLITKDTPLPAAYLSNIKKCFKTFIKYETDITKNKNRTNAGCAALLNIACSIKDNRKQLKIIAVMLSKIHREHKPIQTALNELSFNKKLDQAIRKSCKSIKLPAPNLPQRQIIETELLALAQMCLDVRENKLEQEKSQNIQPSLTIELLSSLAWHISHKLEQAIIISKRYALEAKLEQIQLALQTISSAPQLNFTSLNSLKNNEIILNKRCCTFYQPRTQKMIETIIAITEIIPEAKPS